MDRRCLAFLGILAVALAGCSDPPLSQDADRESETSSSSTPPAMAEDASQPFEPQEVFNESFTLDANTPSRTLDFQVPLGANNVNVTVFVVEGAGRGLALDVGAQCHHERDVLYVVPQNAVAFRTDCALEPGPSTVALALELGALDFRAVGVASFLPAG